MNVLQSVKGQQRAMALAVCVSWPTSKLLPSLRLTLVTKPGVYEEKIMLQFCSTMTVLALAFT